MNPDCQCELAGYCERHRVRKASRLVELCQQRGAYWDAWEADKGPGQGEPAMRREPKLEPAYNHWCKLHYYPVVHAADWDARKAKRFYCGWVAAIPNSRGCACRQKWVEMQVEFEFSTPEAFFESSVDGHNRVSESLGKPTITIAAAYQIWWGEPQNTEQLVSDTNYQLELHE